jgi:hypothetical protein
MPKKAKLIKLIFYHGIVKKRYWVLVFKLGATQIRAYCSIVVDTIGELSLDMNPRMGIDATAAG